VSVVSFAVRHQFGMSVMLAAILLAGCADPEPRPAGVSRNVLFAVTGLYPKSFEITASAPRSFDREKLKSAWQKKALMVANGRHFNSSALVVHDNEMIAYGYINVPVQSRSVTGTITLTD
jgi:hypothetical protein